MTPWSPPRARWAALSVVLSLAACGKPREVAVAPPPPEVVVRAESVVLRTGAIGVKDRQEGTYVFADVTNGTAEDRHVAVLGDLYDDAGTAIEALSLDEMRVPAGGSRTFALVAPVVVAPTTTARVRVRSAAVAPGQPSVVLSAHPLSTREDGRPVQVVTIRSVVSRDGHATVATTFRDDTGAILARPFVILEIRGGRTRDFDFLGPAGATRAESFLTEIVH